MLNGQGINTITQTESTDENGLRSNQIDITASETANSVSATIKDGVGVKDHVVATSTDANGLRSNQVDVTFTDATSDSFTVKDGVGVKSAEQTTNSTLSGELNEYTIKLTDGSSSTIQVYNGRAGKDFRISKTYTSITEMENDFSGTDVDTYEFAMIDTGSVEDEDTGKLYCKGESAWSYIGDLSGAQGIKGDTGNGIASVTNETNSDGNIDVTFTMTDGTSKTITVLNGTNIIAGDNISISDDYTVSATGLIKETGGSITGDLSVSGTITGNVTGNLTGNVTGNADTATTATKLGTENVGSSVKPIYLLGGVATVCEELDHNIPRLVPKDITSYYTDGSLWSRIEGSDGYSLFEDIFVGDFFQMNNTSAAKTGDGKGIQCPSEDSSYTTNTADCSWVMIAGIDTLRGNGNNISMDYHHLVMVPGGGTNYEKNQYFGRHRMNSSNTTSGGYVGSEMFTSVIGDVVSEGSTASGATINQQLYAEFGSHLKTTRELLSNAMTSTLYNRFGSAGGASSSWAWTSCQAVLMSEIEVYGSTVWSSSGYDTSNANRQLPLFKYQKKAQNNRTAYYWLKDIASSSYFCYSGDYGNSDCNVASITYNYLRPRFVIA